MFGRNSNTWCLFLSLQLNGCPKENVLIRAAQLEDNMQRAIIVRRII